MLTNTSVKPKYNELLLFSPIITCILSEKKTREDCLIDKVLHYEVQEFSIIDYWDAKDLLDLTVNVLMRKLRIDKRMPGLTRLTFGLVLASDINILRFVTYLYATGSELFRESQQKADMLTTIDEVLNKPGHANFSKRCLLGLPGSMAEADSSRVAVGFYCLGALDIVGMLDKKVNEEDREAWRDWIWAQQVSRPSTQTGHGAIGGFTPSPFVRVDREDPSSSSNLPFNANPPHLIMTYTALLALAILRDDFSRLDRKGLLNLLRATQTEDGSFTSIPGQAEADMRTVYTAFAISSMLNDWSGIDIPRAITYIKHCLSYEGGFGTSPGNEAQGGPTYCAIASLALVPKEFSSSAKLTLLQRKRITRWLTTKQCAEEGGFKGRTEKDADVCYSFWCGAALDILGANSFVDRDANASFLARSQFRIGGIAKGPDEHADPYHTYLGLAALAVYPPDLGHTVYGDDDDDDDSEEQERAKERHRQIVESWHLAQLDPLINASEETARWARSRISGRGFGSSS